MLENIIEKHMEKLVKELLESNDDAIEDFLSVIGDVRDDELYDLMKHFIGTYLVLKHERPALNVEDLLKDLADHNNIYGFECNISEIRSTRTIFVSPFMTIGELAIAVLCAYNFDMEHSFMVRYRNEIYSKMEGNSSLNELLYQCGMKKGDHVEIIYDFGDEYRIDCTLSTDEVMDADIIDLPKLAGGKGYNIFEDHKELLIELVHNPKKRIEDENGHMVSLKTYAVRFGVTDKLINEQDYADLFSEAVVYYLDDDVDDYDGNGVFS